MKHQRILYFIVGFLALTTFVSAQDDNPFITYDVPAQNLLKYNRFLINPTFSTVREDKSYVNLLHRNQSVSFDDNNQSYFLSYSGRISDRTGLGLSLFTQREGLITNFGVLANYAYGLKLSDKSNFTFGANITYYNSGFDENRANPIDLDPLLNGFQDSSLLSFQPGFNISYGKFDFGIFAENLIDYNLRTSESVSEFKDKTFSGHIQYTHQFKNSSGIMEQGRLMPLARLRKVGEEEVVLGGSLILDLPKLGWVQAGYDSFYGAAAGIGFNLNRRISIGYTMEKGLSNNFDNFGLTHEISFAYSFTPNLTEDRVLLEDRNDDLLVDNIEITEEVLTNKDKEIDDLKKKLAENDAILAELMFRQDSLEDNRQKDLERRFEMVMRMVKRETQGERPDLEERAKQIYFINNDESSLAENTSPKNNVIPNGTENEAKLNAATTTTSLKTNPQDQRTLETPSTDKTITDTSTAIAEGTSKTEVKKDRLNATAEQHKLSTQKNAVAEKSTQTTENTLKPEVQQDRIRATAKQDKLSKVENAEDDEFSQLAQQNNVKSRKFRNLQGVEDGYYVVANVYKGDLYLQKFIDELERKGIQASYFTNPSNGLKYVYLKKSDSWQEALQTYTSKMNGMYEGDLWVMNVDNATYTDKAYATNVTKIKEKAAQYDVDVLQKNVVVKDNTAAPAPTSKTMKIDGVGTGYYIIVNVFANQNNANRFVKLLNSQGLNAGYFINPENKYRYVYLKRHDSWNNALISYYSKINDTYDDKMWIMRVTPNQLT
ncbi:PorP/SprF family type IX secretion system membrane protein [Arenibacter sp. GZD96]|uniref:PorP/SprF family type IX secretion system membrane protein n=1 Tax=Aurantibrevibacter litoralis TaxID=3106030 RepID=UPI002AFF96D4|nr:PorP/SprF family type IX secretion system membrane protein [Arenibacter sp. GZD-96]MEA1786475.1 PorP/SprF family type IX secretion system membrane protein [Arenibacter sp. GZD-96]